MKIRPYRDSDWPRIAPLLQHPDWCSGQERCCFEDLLSWPYTISVVGEHNWRTVCLAVGYRAPKRVGLMWIGVIPAHRRRGYGRELLESLVQRLVGGGSRKVVAEVVETNLEAQLFFKACGWVVPIHGIVRRSGPRGEDVYRFVFRRGSPIQAVKGNHRKKGTL